MDPRAELERVWRRTDELFALLQPAALYDQPIALRQPFIFYVGHLPAFAWNQLGRGVRGAPAVDAHKDDLFARGIDPVDTDAYAAARPEDWPSPARDPRVSRRVAGRGCARSRTRSTSRDDGARTVLHTVLEHERMHHETLLYMFEQLAPSGSACPPRPPPPARRLRAAGASRVPAGTATLGAPTTRRSAGTTSAPGTR